MTLTEILERAQNAAPGSASFDVAVLDWMSEATRQITRIAEDIERLTAEAGELRDERLAA